MIFKSMFIQFAYIRESFKVIVTRDDLIDAVMAVSLKHIVEKKQQRRT